MNLATLAISAVLFFVLSPSILFQLPKNGNKYTVAATHALIFVAILFLMSKLVGNVFEGAVAKKAAPAKKAPPPPPIKTREVKWLCDGYTGPGYKFSWVNHDYKGFACWKFFT